MGAGVGNVGDFQKTFFRGGVEDGAGSTETSDFFAENLRTFEAKHRNFPSKKSDVFNFRNGKKRFIRKPLWGCSIN